MRRIFGENASDEGRSSRCKETDYAQEIPEADDGMWRDKDLEMFSEVGAREGHRECRVVVVCTVSIAVLYNRNLPRCTRQLWRCRSLAVVDKEGAFLLSTQISQFLPIAGS